MAGSDGILEVFTALRGRLARLVIRIAPPDEVEDIVQETYVRVCQIERKDAIREPRSFLFRTAQNLALDHVKRAETRLTSSTDAIDEVGYDEDGDRSGDPTFQQVASDEEFAQFCEAVRRLPQQCRRAFVLKRVYGHTQREIGEIMNISENTVENYIALGVKRCEITLDSLKQSSNLTSRAGKDQTRHTKGPVRRGTMSNVVEISDNEQRLDTASRWIVRMDKGLSADEQTELKRWMAENPKNGERLLSMAQRWDKMHDLSRLAELFPETDIAQGAQRSPRPWFAAVASVLVMVSTAVWWFTDLNSIGVGEAPSDVQTV